MIDLDRVPGPTMHLRIGEGPRVACGMVREIAALQITVVRAEVTCESCRRTKAFIRAVATDPSARVQSGSWRTCPRCGGLGWEYGLRGDTKTKVTCGAYCRCGQVTTFEIEERRRIMLTRQRDHFDQLTDVDLAELVVLDQIPMAV